MEYLHNNKQLFIDILEACSYHMGMNRAIIEKDYYVTLLLRKIVEKCPEVIFKGGTSLSKCHKKIFRFSEDIDLGLNVDKATQSMRKNLKYQIIEAIKELNFILENEDHIYTRRDFNRYQVQYPFLEENVSLKPFLYVETALFLKPFPFEIKQADSYIYRFLKEKNQSEIIEKYNLFPFEVKVQTIDRTFIDKLFALGDYYLIGKTMGYSRHLYDLYKLFDDIIFDDLFYELFNEFQKVRAQDSDCPSAKTDQNLKQLLKEICDKDFYKKDYENMTTELLFEKVTYQTTKDNLMRIIELLKDENQ